VDRGRRSRRSLGRDSGPTLCVMVSAPEMGVDNLAAFVAATTGRLGRVDRIPGGTVVSSAIPLANGYLNAAFRIDDNGSADGFLAAARQWFADIGTPYVVWIDADDDEALHAARGVGGVPDIEDTPAMVVAAPVTEAPGFEVRVVRDGGDRETFGRLCEAGYGITGLAPMLDSQRCYDAPGTTWAIASADGADLSVGCGHFDGTTGGIYYVATPEEHRRRGGAAQVTAWLTNRMLEDGASQVTLQASAAGVPVYRRLGFVTPGAFRRHTFPSGV
jgi:Acetyltransferase (GNAT) domain